ncbi:NAD(P)-dependent oxidoreductase [Thalassospira sp. HJ]|uniref:NAD-dependent epimerase/dehydratase family protein n=1 Tax=Thalassospira sp. HJ TaxID=1616823 RepID=UPI0005CE5091|nr:NAD(P)-dependent oxidoreductase [Thalassospira sp. HJ]
MNTLPVNVTGKKILLIGGAGFIGHNLALELKRQGADVTVADGFRVNSLLNLATESDETKDVGVYQDFLNERLSLLRAAKIKLSILDASSRYAIAKTLDQGFDVVYLLAAVSHASRSNSQPVSAIDNGLIPFVNVITELSTKPETRLVYLSSSTVYGNFTKDSVDETDTCRPFGMYALLKHVGERILDETAQHTDLNFSVVRPSALYGERCISRRVSQIFLENAFAGRELVFLGDQDEKLDFTYIQDLIQGLMLAGLHPNARGEIFNITFGNAQRVLKLTEILKDYFPNIEVKVKERNQATPLRGTLLNDKARNLIGFEPQWPLEEGYRNYITWYIQRSKDHNMIFNTITQTNE